MSWVLLDGFFYLQEIKKHSIQFLKKKELMFVMSYLNFITIGTHQILWL